jgi:hypothetical protein
VDAFFNELIASESYVRRASGPEATRGFSNSPD